MKTLPQADMGEEPLIGADGELVEADSSVDPKVYAEYAAELREASRQRFNSWDDTRVMLVGLIVVAIVAMGIIGLMMGWEVIAAVVSLMVLLALVGLRDQSPF